jgi:hypothetical protein
MRFKRHQRNFLEEDLLKKAVISWRRTMIKFCIAAMGALTMMSAPAFADYYIVHGPDRHCRVVERVPEGGDFVRVGPLHFGTQEEAEGQVRVVCHDNGYYREEARRGQMREREGYREERR